MFLNDAEIAYLCETKGMIKPFEPSKIKKLEDGSKCASYGNGYYGYDIRLDKTLKYPANSIYDDKKEKWNGQIFDLADPSKDIKYDEYDTERFILYPGHMVLGQSVEHFDMPLDVVAIALGKSTWARGALFTNITPLEPGWRGFLTIELSNIGHIPIRLHAGWGIAQLLFSQGHPPTKNYDGGKYQDQKGIQTAKL